MRCARYESQFAANHLGHFQLTCRLWPALVAAESARVVALSSNGHRRAGVYFHDPNFERREYDPRVAYGQSKTANALFAVALDSIGQRQGVRAFSVHSGGIVPDLIRHIRSMRVRLSTKPASRSSIRGTTRRRLNEGRNQRVVCYESSTERYGRRLLRGM